MVLVEYIPSRLDELLATINKSFIQVEEELRRKNVEQDANEERESERLLALTDRVLAEIAADASSDTWEVEEIHKIATLKQDVEPTYLTYGE